LKSLTDHLANYASYHLDRRNIALHFIGIPMIFFSVILLLSRPIWAPDTWFPLSPAVISAALVSLYYLKLDLFFGLLMTLILVTSIKFAGPIAASGTTEWLSWSLGLFVVGWIFQTIGHLYEGRKPAFLDDIIGLLIGPLFVTAKLVFALGIRSDLHQEIEEITGKTRVGKKVKDQP